jgi:hypothetical protein
MLQTLTQLDVFKAKEAIVHAIVSKLGPNVPNGHARQGLVGGQIPDGGDEGVHAIVLALCKEASHQDDMCGCLSQTCTTPVGVSAAVRPSGLESPCVVGFVVCRKGLNLNRLLCD